MMRYRKQLFVCRVDTYAGPEGIDAQGTYITFPDDLLRMGIPISMVIAMHDQNTPLIILGGMGKLTTDVGKPLAFIIREKAG